MSTAQNLDTPIPYNLAKAQKEANQDAAFCILVRAKDAADQAAASLKGTREAYLDHVGRNESTTITRAVDGRSRTVTVSVPTAERAADVVDASALATQLSEARKLIARMQATVAKLPSGREATALTKGLAKLASLQEQPTKPGRKLSIGLKISK